MPRQPREGDSRSDADAALRAARYRLDRESPEEALGETDGQQENSDPGSPTPEQRAAYVETSIQQAIRRGDFDDLPGAGKPLEGLREAHDPNWWIRRKIETERLTGLGPPAMLLRAEDAELNARLDRLFREEQVREALVDFNRRVIEARRQLQGGPPVVTATRDIDAEVRAWRERRAARDRARAERVAREREAWQALGWRERWRARRRGEEPPGASRPWS